MFLLTYLLTCLLTYCLGLKRGRRQNGRVHCRRLYAGARQTRADGRYLWSRDLPSGAAELHGADGGPVHLHPRRAARGRPVRQHGDLGPPSLRAPAETLAAARRRHLQHGERV